jgi:hypothetical protein
MLALPGKHEMATIAFAQLRFLNRQDESHACLAGQAWHPAIEGLALFFERITPFAIEINWKAQS